MYMLMSFLDAQSSYFSGAPSVVFHLQEGPSRDSLTKVLSRGYAACVHVSTTNKKCDIKVMILLYNKEKNTYLGCTLSFPFMRFLFPNKNRIMQE